MSRRTRRQENLESQPEQPISVEEALNSNVEVSIFDKFADIVSQYGSNLILRAYAIKSDTRSLGFIDEIVGDEIDLFLQAPESFLRDKFGPGTFRIIVVNGGTRKFITNLTISISSPKNLTPTPNTDYLSEVTKSFHQGLNLGKSSQPNNNQAPLDLTKLMELVMLQQEKAREREEKTIERIREQENKLRAKELELLEKVYSNNVDASKQLEPMIQFMAQSGKVLGSAMSMIEKSANFMHTFSPQNEPSSFWERILIGVSEKLLNTNPQLFERVLPMLSNLNIPTTPSIPVRTMPISNQNTETKTSKEETPRPEANRPNFEQVLQMLLLEQLERATVDIEAEFCAESILTNLEVLLKKSVITNEQLTKAYEILCSDHLAAFIRTFYPNTVEQSWLVIFQQTIRTDLEPQEENPEETRQ